MNISQEQLAFLQREFGLEYSAIKDMNVDQWQEVREKCFDIEAEEAGLADDGNSPLSERGNIAVSLADLKFVRLMAE